MKRGAAELLRSQVGVLSPLVQVRRGDVTATTPGPHIGESVRLEEEEWLQFLHVVHAVTHHPGQTGGSDLLKYFTFRFRNKSVISSVNTTFSNNFINNLKDV